MYDKVLITAASASYAPSLLALVGSVRCNWPDAPPILVYDLGLSADVVSALEAADVEVRKVPEFCNHWRRHYAWKFWCFLDVPATTYFWLDAGILCMRPMPEVFMVAERMGYFAVSLYNHPVGPSVPDTLLESLGITRAAANEIISISSGIHAIRKSEAGLKLLTEAYNLALIEGNLKATKPEHRHDQALLTLLMEKHFGALILADYHIYAHHFPTGPGASSLQKTWVHRRKIQDCDASFFADHLVGGPSFLPVKGKNEGQQASRLFRLRVAVAKWRGRYPGDGRVDIDSIVSDGFKD